MSTDQKTAVDIAPLPPEVEKALPVVADVPVSLDAATGEDESRIRALMAEIDMTDSNSIIHFGNAAQEKLTTISDAMLEGVKTKDVGPAGDALSGLVATIRGFDVDGLNPNKKLGFWARLFGKARPVVKFLQRYEAVGKQIDRITIDLEGHKTQLLTDITSLDHLYEANVDYFHQLEHYIAAGEAKVTDLDENEIPREKAEAEASDDMLEAQELRDIRAARDDLERRVHDLKLTRQVSLQSLPSIRMVQENDKSLVTKINSTLVNTVPLWRNQLAQAVTIYRMGQAADSVKAAGDLTNELLEKNAETLKDANAETRRQIERGVFDIESIKKANQTLIEAIEESLKIADEGKVKRAAAEAELVQLEASLKQQLLRAKAHAEGEAPAATE